MSKDDIELNLLNADFKELIIGGNFDLERPFTWTVLLQEWISDTGEGHLILRILHTTNHVSELYFEVAREDMLIPETLDPILVMQAITKRLEVFKKNLDESKIEAQLKGKFAATEEEDGDEDSHSTERPTTRNGSEPSNQNLAS